jgi:hypothetical protein
LARSDSSDAIAKVSAISADFLPIPDTDTANTADTPDTDTDSIGTALVLMNKLQYK